MGSPFREPVAPAGSGGRVMCSNASCIDALETLTASDSGRSNSSTRYDEDHRADGVDRLAAAVMLTQKTLARLSSPEATAQQNQK